MASGWCMRNDMRESFWHVWRFVTFTNLHALERFFFCSLWIFCLYIFFGGTHIQHLYYLYVCNYQQITVQRIFSSFIREIILVIIIIQHYFLMNACYIKSIQNTNRLAHETIIYAMRTYIVAVHDGTYITV